MSKKALQSVIGRAVTDASFRNSLFADPDTVLDGYDLTDGEIAALKAIDAETLDNMAGDLDDRMSKVSWNLFQSIGYSADSPVDMDGSDPLAQGIGRDMEGGGPLATGVGRDVDAPVDIDSGGPLAQGSRDMDAPVDMDGGGPLAQGSRDMDAPVDMDGSDPLEQGVRDLDDSDPLAQGGSPNADQAPVDIDRGGAPAMGEGSDPLVTGGDPNADQAPVDIDRGGAPALGEGATPPEADSAISADSQAPTADTFREADEAPIESDASDPPLGQ